MIRNDFLKKNQELMELNMSLLGLGLELLEFNSLVSATTTPSQEQEPSLLYVAYRVPA